MNAYRLRYLKDARMTYENYHGLRAAPPGVEMDCCTPDEAGLERKRDLIMRMGGRLTENDAIIQTANGVLVTRVRYRQDDMLMQWHYPPKRKGGLYKMFLLDKTMTLRRCRAWQGDGITGVDIYSYGVRLRIPGVLPPATHPDEVFVRVPVNSMEICNFEKRGKALVLTGAQTGCAPGEGITSWADDTQLAALRAEIAASTQSSPDKREIVAIARTAQLAMRYAGF